LQNLTKQDKAYFIEELIQELIKSHPQPLNVELLRKNLEKIFFNSSVSFMNEL
jgi:hypothetical protein